MIIGYDETCGNEVVVPATIEGIKVTEININSFDSEITSLDLSDAIYLRSIGTYTFNNDSISELLLPLNGQLKSIGTGAFMSNNLSEVVIPKSIEQITRYAFGSNNLTKVVIPGSIKTISSSFFYNNLNLTDIIIKKEDSTGINLVTNCISYIQS